MFQVKTLGKEILQSSKLTKEKQIHKLFVENKESKFYNSNADKTEYRVNLEIKNRRVVFSLNGNEHTIHKQNKGKARALHLSLKYFIWFWLPKSPQTILFGNLERFENPKFISYFLRFP